MPQSSCLLAGPPAKRLKASPAAAEFDDDEELLALARTPCEPSEDGLAGANVSNHAVAAPKPAYPPQFSSTQEALEDEQEIAELVRLANSTIPIDANAAHDDSARDMLETSAAACETMQPASTLCSVPTNAPSWSGADIDGDSMTVTLQDGRRAFCRLHAQHRSIPAQPLITRNKLLSAPIASMMQDVEQECFAKALQDSELAKKHAHRLSQVQAVPSSMREQQPHRRALWVDKYSPQSFFELLSDDQINREVVRWVKSWDLCAHPRQTAQSLHAAAQHQQGPEQKLLLLSGPPGAF